MNLRWRDLVLMMLWRCWGLGWTKRGMLLPLSSSGYSPVSSRHMLSKCHEVTLSNSVTSSSPLCSFLPLPSQGGSQWLFRAWKLLATCSAHTLSTQQFLSLPLAAFSLHLTAPRPRHSVPDRCHPPEPPQTPSTSSPASHVWPLEVLVPCCS